MIPTVAIATSPFNCRWIVPGSAHHMDGWSYAICVRVRDTERLVNETDCSRCPRWEEPDERPEQHVTARS
jgi:hypothetical protein